MDQCQVKLVKTGSNNGMQIGVEFELPGTDALIKKEGENLVIEPIRKRRLNALLDSWEQGELDSLEIEDHAPAAEEIFGF